MVDLQSSLESFGKAETQVVGISYDEVDILRAFADSKSISFTLLSDPSSKVIRDYQLLDERESGKYFGVPSPTTVVVDSEKKVRLVILDTIKKRLASKQLVKKLSELK